MKELIVISKEGLIDAQHLVNVLHGGKLNTTKEVAEVQIEVLIKQFEVPATQEALATIQTDIVAKFCEFCKGQELEIPDTYFEEFFGA